MRRSETGLKLCVRVIYAKASLTHAPDIERVIVFLHCFSDDVWKVHRKALNYSFNLKILQTFIPIFIDNSQALVKDLSVNIGKKKEFDMLHYTTKAALNMICGKYNSKRPFLC